MKRLAFAAAAVAALSTTLPAQTLRPEIRPFGGVTILTGDQRAFFEDAAMFGMQTALELKPYLHVLGTFAWAPAQNRYPVPERTYTSSSTTSVSSWGS